MVVAVLVPSTGPIRHLTQRGARSAAVRDKRLYNDSMRIYDGKNFMALSNHESPRPGNARRTGG